jgi:hypothetical protein
VAPVATREPAVTLASLEVAFLEEARLAGEGGREVAVAAVHRQ